MEEGRGGMPVVVGMLLIEEGGSKDEGKRVGVFWYKGGFRVVGMRIT